MPDYLTEAGQWLGLGILVVNALVAPLALWSLVMMLRLEQRTSLQ